MTSVLKIKQTVYLSMVLCLIPAGFAWGDCTPNYDCLTVDALASGNTNVKSTDSPKPYFLVSNQNNTTTITIKTPDGHKFVAWKQTPEYDFNSSVVVSLNIFKAGNYVGFASAALPNNLNLQSYMIVVDIKNNLVTSPMQDIYTYSAAGLGVFEDPQSKYNLVIRPLFGSCVKPEHIALNKERINEDYIPAPIFNDNTHLQIQYNAMQAKPVESDVIIDPAKIFAQCGQTYTNS